VANWLPELSEKLGVPPEELVDLVVVLGKGVIWHSSAFKEVDPLVPPENATWAFFEQEDRNLFMLFMHMLTWVSYLSVPPSALGYVSRVFFEPYAQKFTALVHCWIWLQRGRVLPLMSWSL